METLLERLVALNAKRAAEEAAGTVRWLRPEFQLRGATGHTAIDTSMPEAEAVGDDDEPTATSVPVAVPVVKRPWPFGLAEQIKAVADVTATTTHAMGLPDF